MNEIIRFPGRGDGSLPRLHTIIRGAAGRSVVDLRAGADRVTLNREEVRTAIRLLEHALDYLENGEVSA